MYISNNSLMTRTVFELQIDCSPKKICSVNNILGVKSSSKTMWILEKIITEKEGYFPFVDFFLKILEGNYLKLEELGIQRENISVWMIYEYDSQCNMEFLPEQMYKLGKEGIVLCVSCYDIHDYNE